MTPTDNLEAGAGDLVAVAWRYCSHDINGDPWPWVYTETKPAAHAEVEPLYSAAQLSAVTAENARLREALEVIRELNTTGADENGHRWAHSDLVDQEIFAALSQEAPK